MSQLEILLWVHSISLTKCWDTAILWAPPICHFVSDHKIQWICSIFHSISHISMFCICEHHWFDTFGGAHLKAAMDLCNLPMDLTNPICDQESFHISQVIVSASTEYFNSISIGYRAWARHRLGPHPASVAPVLLLYPSSSSPYSCPPSVPVTPC